MQRELDQLRATMAAETPPAADTVTTEPDGDQRAEESAGVASRRNLLKLAGAAAGGAAVGALALGNRAAAADGDSILLGEAGTVNNTSQSLTGVNYTGAGTGASFLFQSGNAYSPGVAAYDCALAGWTTTATRPNGIYGYTPRPETPSPPSVMGRHLLESSHTAGAPTHGWFPAAQHPRPALTSTQLAS